MDMSLLGIIVALVVLIIICYRKFNPVVGTLICVAILAIFSGLSVLDTITDTYFTGFSDFLKNNFLLFATGTVFASLMEGSGAAAAFAKMIYSKVGGRGAIYGCMLAVLILGYIGVNGWALMFIAYPIFLCVFKQENLPRWLIPGVIYTSLAYNSSMFPGSPSILNVLPTQYLGTDTMAASGLGIATGIFCSILCIIYLEYEFRKAKKNNDGFVITPDIAEKMKAFEELETVKPWRSVVPMILLFVLLNVFKVNVNIAIILASFCCVILYWNTTPKKLNLIDMLSNLGGNPLISFASATTLIAGATGSGSGGIGIAMEVFAQKYMDLGVNPAVLHRIAAIACNGLDTLPHNSMVITCLAACGMTHKESYKPIFITSVCITLIGLAFAVFLGIAFY